jgi:hypothetical protein
MDSFYIGCYWGARAETVEECSKKVSKTLALLMETGLPYFQQWYKLGKSRKDALKHKVTINEAELVKLLEKGRDRFFPDLGYSLSLWNGLPEEEDLSISFRCGSTFAKTGNTINFNLPKKGEQISDLINFERVYNLLSRLIPIWVPDWAVVDSYSLIDLIPENEKLGWLTFFSNQYQESELSSHPSFNESLAGYGDFLIVTKDVFSSGNPVHIAKLRELVDKTVFKHESSRTL